MLLLGALLCYAYPDHWRSRSRITAAVAIGSALGLLISVLPIVFPSGRLEHSLGELVTGVNLTLRAESSGVVVLLLASGIALIALLEGARRPVEHAALLLCLLGTAIAALGGNAVLLFGGLELGNVGAVMLAATGLERLSNRDRAGFVFQHIAALGLLIAALRVQIQYQTGDFVALPPGAVGTAVGLAWAASGVARVLAAPGLAGPGGRSSTSVWTAVVAVPTGMLVLVRLLQVGGGALPSGVGPMLMGAGLIIGCVGAVEALRNVSVPAAAGRALCLAAAGPVVFCAGVSNGRGIGAFAASGLALCLALAMAPAWGGGGAVARGTRARWLRAAALASAGGVPVGYGVVALLLTADIVATLGQLGALTAIAFAAVTAMTVAAAVGSARASLVIADPDGSPGGVRWDAAIAVAAGLVAAVIPGVIQNTFVRGVAGDGATTATAVDGLAFRGAGGAWPGGYLSFAVAICAASAIAVAVLLERRVLAPDTGVTGTQPARPPLWSPLQRRAASVSRSASIAMRWFDRIDRWMVGQPRLAMVLAGAAVLVVIFR